MQPTREEDNEVKGLQLARTKPDHLIRSINRIAYNRVVPALLWLGFAYSSFSRLNESIGAQNWLLNTRLIGNVLFTLLIIILFLIRHPVKGSHANVLEAIVALAGTFAPLLIGNQPVTISTNSILVAGNLIGLAGMIFSIISLATLGRSFGILPEARELVTSGPYNKIRHPLYLGEILIVTGMVLPIFTWITLLMFAGYVLLQIWRTFNEEQALEKVFPQYRQYQEQTWRLIPYIW
jgi:protein-S-isoprenylcysteine O-methyltransferase Ste14